MSNNIKNLKHNLSNPKIRTIFILLLIILIIGAIIGYLEFKKSLTSPISGGAKTAGVPGIRSIPGVGSPSARYTNLQAQHNRALAQKAAQAQQHLQPAAAVPTVARAAYTGTYLPTVTGQQPPGCSVEELRKAREAGVTASELRCRGCSAAALKAAGYTAAELKAAGFTAAQLKAAGFTAKQLRAAGFTAGQLKDAGFTAAQLKDAGFSAKDLEEAGFTPAQLKNAGFTDAQIKAAEGLGLPPGVKDCSISSLQKARAEGISAAKLKSCGAAALKAAGYTAKELKDAGFTAAQLKAAGFNAKQLKDAGFSAKQLRDAGFTAAQLKKAGFTPAQLKAAGFTDGDLIRAGFTPDEIRPSVSPTAGLPPGVKDCSIASLQQARAEGISAAQLKSCGVAALKAAGYTAKELKDAGFTAAQLAKAGFTPQQLKAAGFTDAQIRAAQAAAAGLGLPPGVKDCSIASLQKARAEGISAAQLKSCGAAALKAAGYTAAQLANAGFAVPPTTIATIATPPTTATDSLQDKLAALQQLESKTMTQAQIQNTINQLKSNMQMQANDLFSSWTPLPTMQFVAGPSQATSPEAAAAAAKAMQLAQQQANIAYVIPAYTPIYAVLDTGINSDEKSPILATITSGKLKGSKLAGSFRRTGEAVVVEFNQLKVPHLKNALSISGYAVDPETARIAMSSSVNNHYFKRYGALFAASFLGGYASAIQQAGGSISIIPGGGIIYQVPQLNPTEQVMAGLGKVGTQFSSILQRNVNIPPTVRLRAGSTIALYLRQAVVIPKYEPQFEIKGATS